MPEVSFYHLTKQPLEKALPGLLERVVEAGHRVLLRVNDAESARFLDDALWTYSEGAFLAHGTAKTGHCEAQPIYITDKTDNPNGGDVLVAVNNADTSDAKDYPRTLYMFDGMSDEVMTGARARWKQLKSDGFDLKYWQQSPEGKWLKKDL